MTSSVMQKACTNTAMASGGSSPQVQPCHIFGVCKGVRNNLLFQDEETMIFPSGNHCVRYHVLQRRTKFIHGVKGSMKALALSPDRRYLAVSESDKWGTITIFDLEDEKCCKKQVLKGSDYSVQEFVCMAFSADSKYLLGQAGGPTWTLYFWQWQEKELIDSVKTTRNGLISQVSFNPQDEKQICVSGKRAFKIFELKKASLRQANSYNMKNEDVLCHMWLSGDCIIAGTEAGKLLKLKSRQLHQLGRPYERQTEKKDSTSSPDQLASVTAITQYSKGFACSAGLGLVCLYEISNENDNYRKTAEISIPVDPYSSQPLQAIATMCFSPAEKTLVISTDRGKLYSISLTSTEISESKKAQFEFLSHSLHSESITGMSICTSKPLVATCSKDFTVHIWNYKTNSLDQFKEFDEEPLCVSMHPNGLSILVGFSSEIRLMHLHYDKIRTVQKFPTKNCTECVFNHDGNMFAAVNKKVIHVYNIRTGKKLDLNAHLKKVQSVKWREDDLHLVSCGMDAIVCTWDVLTGSYKTSKETDCGYTDMIFTPNTGSVLAVDRCSLKEIDDGSILRQMASDGVDYTAISMTRSGQTIFIGTAVGTVEVIEYPFGKEKTWTELQAHSGPITKMVVTPGDQYLLTASEDGSLLIWTITDPEGKTLKWIKEMEHADEVLCTKEELEEKDQTICELTSHTEWLKLDLQCKLNWKDMEYTIKMKSFFQGYRQQMKALKDQIQVLNTEREDQKDSHQKALTELKEEHAKQLEDQKQSRFEGLLDQDELYHELQQKMQMMEKNHAKKLRNAEDSHLCAMEDMKQAYEAKLRELRAELEQEVKNFEEKQVRIKEVAESEVMELCRNYEHDLQLEKDGRLKAEHELKLMEKNISRYLKMKRMMEDQEDTIRRLKENMQKLKDQLDDATERIEALNKKKEEKNKTIDDQTCFIEELQHMLQNEDMSLEDKQEELVQMIFWHKKGEEKKSYKERSKIQRLEKEIQEKKEMLDEAAAELALNNRKNEDIIYDLKEKLKSNNTELFTERQRVRNINMVVQKMKDDIRSCARFIQEPMRLKQNFIELHTRHIHTQDGTIGVNAEVTEEETRYFKDFHTILAQEKAKHVRDMKLEKDRYSKLVKERGFLINQLYEQKLMHEQLLNSLKRKNVQCDDTASSVIPPGESRLQLSVNQRLTRNPLNMRRGQVFASDHVRFPPINTT
ncbi:cilia- and flagella-associated protein 57 isoform X2 [Ictalurus punctatus]|uniref:Cilia- and flagella-associated protein 57 isoform X2 n=1 Tax=Ictalurus punctatus TaxID=7998 RepID=A0A2D0PVZ5_ICTPU|nr:cilia- and flagella-associated protein 57 isoform X2 [Ictalurus punctatus]